MDKEARAISGAGAYMTMMDKIVSLRNGVRRLDSLFPSLGANNPKHDFYRDFGFKNHLTFYDFFRMSERNGLACGAIKQTLLTTWQDYPAICENEDAEETATEEVLRRHFEKIRLWQKIADVDRRSMVGSYAALILRVADNKKFNEPLETVHSGLTALVEVIPAWEGQLTISSWEDDETQEDYGHPRMFNFNESNVVEGGTQLNNRSFEVHPSRVIIWSNNGTVNGQSELQAGFNDLVTMEKIVGAGGEGFWKNATGRPVLEMDKDIQIEHLARGMGVPIEEVPDKIEDQVADYTRGFDETLLLQGMTAKNLAVNMISPEHAFNVALQCFCASWPIPAKRLTGSQTGERASSEDNDSWRQTNNSRRTNIAVPSIMTFIDRLVEYGMLPENDWLRAGKTM